MQEYKARKQENISRDRDFGILYGIYEGLFNESGKGQDIMDGRGRPILRDTRRRKGQQPLVANLLQAIVDDYVSMTGVVPDIKVPPPGTTQADQDFADRLEKFHYGVWHASQMVLQLKQMAWFESVMGGCSAIIWPNFKRKHAEIRFVSPDRVYGVADIIDPFSFSSCIVAETYEARSIKDYFPQSVVQRVIEGWQGTTEWSRTKTVEIVRWFDKSEVVTLIGRSPMDIKDDGQAVEVGRARHELDRCLVVPFQNKLLPGQIRGGSDIEQAVGLNQHINNLMNANEEYIKQELFAPLILIDPQKFPEDINMADPYAVIPVNAGGNAFRLGVSTAGEQVMTQQLARGQHLIEYVTGQSRVRTEGRLESSITTGRAIQKAQGPIFGRIEYRNDLNGFRLERCNELAVMLTERMFPKDDIVLFGTARRGGTFRATLHGEDLQGYTFNKVLYSPSMFMGFEQRLISVLQMRSAKPRPLIDERTGLEMLGLVDHPDEMMKVIAREMEQEVAFQAKLRGAAEGGGVPDVMGAERGAVALSSGAPSPGALPAVAPRPPMPSAEAVTMGGPMTGQDIGSVMPMAETPKAPSGFEGAPDLAAQVRNAISGIELRGTAYVVEATSERIRIVVVPPSPQGIDGRKVGRVLRERFGDRVSVRESKTVPAGATPVSGGTP